MCDLTVEGKVLCHIRLVCWAFVIFCLAFPTGITGELHGQTTDDYRTQVERLRQEWSEADSALQEFYERESAAPIDTIRVGTLTVLTQQDFGEVVRLGAQAAWDTIRDLGADTLLLSGKTLFVPGPGWSNRYDRDRHRASASAIQLAREADGEDAAEHILSSAAMLLLDEWWDEVRSWLGGMAELDDANQTNLGWTYVEIVTAPSQAVRGCLLGDLGACGSALGLVEVEDPELEWYNADERRVVVGRRLPGKSADRAQSWLQCVNDSSDAACVDYLTGDADYEVPAPLSFMARRTLVGVALESGGDGAYTRLLRSRDLGRETSLAAAAGLSPDSLLALWRMEVLSGAPEPTTLTQSGAATTLLWIMIFVAAATRSTRWRLG